MENNLNDKYLKLIDEEEEFSINKEILLKLVNSDNIKSEQSYEILKALGGINGLMTKLNINPFEGINEQDTKELKIRKQYFGKNEAIYPLTKNFFDCFLDILNQKVFLILIFAATVRLLIDLWRENGKWFDFTSIYITVLILCLAMSIIDYSKEKVFSTFQTEIKKKNVRVLRNGEEKLISQNELLIGDILIICSGEIIPVDGAIIKSFSITIDSDESVFIYHDIDYVKQKLNPEECDKTEFPFVLSGSYVVKGFGYMLVLCVGLETYLNKSNQERVKKNKKNEENSQNSERLADDEEKEFELNNENDPVTEKNTRINRLMSANFYQINKENSSNLENSSDFKEKDIIDNNIGKKNIEIYTEEINEISNYKNKENFPIHKGRSILKRNDKSIESGSSKIDMILSKNNLSKGQLSRSINIYEIPESIQTEKDIVDYAEEYNQLTQNKKNLEIKSGYYKNKSMTSFNSFKKKEIINVRSKDKRHTDTNFFYYSPMKLKILEIEEKLSKFGIIASIISGLSFLLVYIFISYPENFHFSGLIEIVIDALLYGLVLVVLAVPEGLPLASTLSAAFSINKMRDENTIIKSIQACENMATINCICTDFNGVFTKNEMKVSKIFIEEQVLDERQIRYLKSEISQDSFDFLCEAISINTIAYSAKNQNTFQLEYFGDTVETSLIKYLKEIRVNYSDFRNNKQRPIIECNSYSAEYNLSYTVIEMDGKYDYVRLYLRGNPDDLLDNLNNYITNRETLERINPKYREKIKKFCKDATKDGELPLFICYRDVPREHFLKMRHAFINKEPEFLKGLITQLNLIAIMCMKDDIKEDIKSYIEECNRAGIIVKMVTSQDRDTAKIAAEKCGILSQKIVYVHNNSEDTSECESDDKKFNETAIDTTLIIGNKNIDKPISNFLIKREIKLNPELEILDCYEDLKKLIDLKQKKKSINMTNSYHSFEFLVNDITKFEKIIQNSKVISKATAKDKYILISTLKKNGYVVAVTGDSVSDYLAMKSAQVSISMGYKATDMSKESADVILCDNSFKNILTGITYGRNIYNSVKKFIQFQMTASISIILLALISGLPLINFYFYPNQILWLNLILDTLGSISLASEQPNREEVLSKKPYSNKKNLITKTMKIRILVQAFIQVFIILNLVFFAPCLFDIDSDRDLDHNDWLDSNGIHTTVILCTLVYLQFFNAFISRNLSKNNMNIFKNLKNHQIFVIIQIFIILVNYIMVTYGYRIIRSKPLPLILHLYCFTISSFVLVSLPIIKYLANNYKFNFL